ncbi:Phosphatase DCR2 [Hondaea fermentalgiana]|uniref:Phosphatase DCR2 n=1 Tax=Hondaea fermentalgiana TaxID=2315210 RepID=A0A2R5GFS6_9STRA|nr:Phosphatase DCR2 [Hondaea fermentalgiana]|eukprot:GBG29772.1 Phosphatase DCR2 [Hondaea fermentalgiana]
MEDIGHVKLECGLPEGSAMDHPGGIVIAQFTDLHQFPADVKTFEARGRVIEFEKEGYSSARNVDLIRHVLKEATPDLCIFTGDIVDGRPCKDLGRDAFKQVMLEVLAPVLEAKIPWTYIPGNHKAKTFNHTLTVGRTAEADAASSLRLWLFDSGTNSDDPKIMYTTFAAETVREYARLSASGELAPSAEGLAFFHIPLPEYQGTKPLAGKNGLFEAAILGGKAPWPVMHEPFKSLVRWIGKDLVAGCSKLNSGLFDAIKKQGNILATFCGHDHHSDFVARRDNVYLCYGRCGSYTPPHDWEGAGGPLPFDHGARLVQFKGRDQVFTWNCTFENAVEDYIHLERKDA